MGRKKVFGITRYREIERNGSTPCIEEDCDGKIVYVRTRIDEIYEEISKTETLFYRCTSNCRHHWKVMRNNLNKKLVFMKY